MTDITITRICSKDRQSMEKEKPVARKSRIPDLTDFPDYIKRKYVVNPNFTNLSEKQQTFMKENENRE